jgi:hypothetical protein
MATDEIVKVPGIWRHKSTGRLFKDVEIWDGFIFVFIDYTLWIGNIEGFGLRFERVEEGGIHAEG